jgi:hypothetical protein
VDFLAKMPRFPKLEALKQRPANALFLGILFGVFVMNTL